MRLLVGGKGMGQNCQNGGPAKQAVMATRLLCARRKESCTLSGHLMIRVERSGKEGRNAERQERRKAGRSVLQ